MYGISYGMSPIMLTFSKIQDNGYAMLQRLKYASSLGLIRMSALSIFTSVQLQRCLFVTAARGTARAAYPASRSCVQSLEGFKRWSEP